MSVAIIAKRYPSCRKGASRMRIGLGVDCQSRTVSNCQSGCLVRLATHTLLEETFCCANYIGELLGREHRNRVSRSDTGQGFRL